MRVRAQPLPQFVGEDNHMISTWLSLLGQEVAAQHKRVSQHAVQPRSSDAAIHIFGFFARRDIKRAPCLGVQILKHAALSLFQSRKSATETDIRFPSKLDQTMTSCPARRDTARAQAV